MHKISGCRALMALCYLCLVAFALFPLTVTAQTTPGSVLFSRTTYGTVVTAGTPVYTPISSTTFIIGDDGLHERTLTSSVTGTFNLASVAGYESLWMTNAFNPAGTWSVYLQAQEKLPQGSSSNFHGKYYITNAYGLRTPAVFYGANDLQSASVGPSYGSVSWGPAGNNQLAYAHNPDTLFGAHPACVSLMHSDGTNNHKLWCASTWIYCAIEAIRWSGDGSSILAYAVHTSTPVNAEPQADLFSINTATGLATVVEANVPAPFNGGFVGDISYDGHEVIYAVFAATNEPGPCHAADAYTTVWCAKDMRTGKTIALVDPSNAVSFGADGQMLISPDGTQAYLSSIGQTVSDIYAVKTDGTGLRQITSPCATLAGNDQSRWGLVRVSPDNTRILANCHIERISPSSTTDQIFVVNLANNSTRLVTNGVAYDWHATP